MGELVLMRFRELRVEGRGARGGGGGGGRALFLLEIQKIKVLLLYVLYLYVYSVPGTPLHCAQCNVLFLYPFALSAPNNLLLHYFSHAREPRVQPYTSTFFMKIYSPPPPPPNLAIGTTSSSSGLEQPPPSTSTTGPLLLLPSKRNEWTNNHTYIHTYIHTSYGISFPHHRRLGSSSLVSYIFF